MQSVLCHFEKIGSLLFCFLLFDDFFFIFIYQFSNDIKNEHWNFEYLMHTLKNETNK